MSKIKEYLEETEERFEDLMKSLPVNDYRVYHNDLITNEFKTTLRGEVIKSFIISRQQGLIELIRGEIEQHFYGANDVKVKDITNLLQK